MSTILNIKDNFGANISSNILAETIYTDIKKHLKNDDIILDLRDVTSITTYCASLIFGQLYYELGDQQFFQRIKINNASRLIKIVIHEGILGYLEKMQ